MSKPSTPTRVAADVAATAKAVGQVEHRSLAEQVSHWARIGMQIERSGSVANRRVLDVAAGRGQFASLTDDERATAHALIDARISELADSQSFGDPSPADAAPDDVPFTASLAAESLAAPVFDIHTSKKWPHGGGTLIEIGDGLFFRAVVVEDDPVAGKRSRKRAREQQAVHEDSPL